MNERKGQCGPVWDLLEAVLRIRGRLSRKTRGGCELSIKRSYTSTPGGWLMLSDAFVGASDLW